MNRYGLMALLLSASAAAQATHNGFIWVEGPSEALAADTTYTLEVWARFESPLWVDGESMIAGFGIDILNVGGGSFVGGVSNVRIEDWAISFGIVGAIVGNDIVGISGGQLPSGWVDPQDPPPPPPAINRLFTFDFTTAAGPLGAISFSPAHPNPNGGLSFYPDGRHGASIIFPNTPGTQLHLDGWTSTVPSPSLGLTLLLLRLKLRPSRVPE